MTRERWLRLARTPTVRRRIAADRGLADFQEVVRVAARRKSLDWAEAVAALHMVYGWMPTMLRPTQLRIPADRKRLLSALRAARQGQFLGTKRLATVQKFANRSIVGASKLLHVLNPASYVIWDSRVAQAFLWDGVSPGTCASLDRYVEYLTELRSWANDQQVVKQCVTIRGWNPALAKASDVRLIELVLYRSMK